MSVKKGLSIFLLLTIFVSGTVLFFSIDKSSWLIFEQASKFKMFLAFSLVVVVWLLDALKFKLLTRASGERIRYGLALELTWINYFGAAITPMQSGGGPFQMYILYKNGISLGTAMAITLVRTFLTMLILGFMILFSFAMRLQLPDLGWGMRGFVFYVIAFSLAVWFFAVLSIVRPSLIKRICWKIIAFLKHFGFLGNARVIKMFRKVSAEIDSYNQNIRSFITTGRLYFALGAITASFQIIVYLSVMPCMIRAMGMPVMYVDCLLVQALFLFLLYFIPTPGGSGAAEGGAALIFSIFVPWSVAGMMGVAWRLLTEYTGIGLGALVAMKILGWNVTEEIMERDKENKESRESSATKIKEEK